MNRNKIVLTALTLMAVTPATLAEIYKCDSPGGPIYSDRKCGPDAANVQLSDTSGLTGVSDEIKAELAERKAERERVREENRKLQSNRTVINNNYTTIQQPGRWLNYPYWRPKPERPPPPEVTPTPLPSTLGGGRR